LIVAARPPAAAPDAPPEPRLETSLVEKVVVTPRPQEMLRDQPEPRQALTGEALQQEPNLGADVNRAVSRQAGLASGDRSAEVSIRGGGADEVLFVLDGLEILDPFHLKALQSFSGIVDGRALEAADVLSGGFPAEYGDRMSGVIDLSSGAGAHGARTIFGSNFFNSHFLSNDTFAGGAGEWLLSARAWYPDALNSVITPAGEEIGPKYSDFFGKTRIQVSDATTLTGSLLLSYDRANYTSDADHEPSEEITAHSRSQYGWLRLDSAPTGRLLSKTYFSFSQIVGVRYGSSEGDGGEAIRVDDRRSFEVYGFRQDWMYQALDSVLLKLGLEAKRVNGAYDYSSSLIGRAVSLSPSGDELGAYAAGRIRMHRDLTTELGLRWDRQTHTSESQLSPRINILYAPGDRNALRFGWGRFYQSQGIHELQVEDGVSGFFPAQLAEHRLVSFETRLTPALRLSFSAYDKSVSRARPRFENLFDPLDLFPEARADRVRIEPERASARGLEISLRSAAGGRLHGWVNYAYASVEDEIDGEWVPRSWDQRHAVNFGLNFSPTPLWSFDVAGAYHSGWPTTEVSAETEQAPDGSLTIQPVLGARNAERFPAYHRLDLKVSRHVTLSRGRLTLYVEVLNVYDQENPCCVDEILFTPREDGSVRTLRDEDFWIGRLPTIGAVWEIRR
jgi:hypothetical protein